MNDLELLNLKAMFDQPIIGMAFASLDGQLTRVNIGFATIVGRSCQELTCFNFRQLTHPDDLGHNLELLQKLNETGEAFDHKKRYLRPDGSVVWVRNHVSLVKNDKGEPVSYLGICIDITEEKNQESEREEQRRQAAFMADISIVLAASLDYKTTLKKVTELIVPAFGDWCYVHLKNEEGKIELAQSATILPDIEEGLKEFATLAAKEGTQNAVATALTREISLKRNSLDDKYYLTVASNARQLELFRVLRPYSVIVVPLKARGTLLGTITVSSRQKRDYSEADVNLIEDVARRAALAIDNARLYRQSRQATEARDAFVSMASHELKTPITSLMLLNDHTCSKFAKDTIPPLTDDYWRRLFRDYEIHISRISRLVENMLDLTRLELKTYKMNVVENDLGRIILLTCDHLDSQIKLAGSSLVLNLKGDLTGKFDSHRIEQVLANIITNSLKYAPKSPITITTESDDKKIHVMVSDHGGGIEEKDLQRIFERFERAEPGKSGLGLGLYISRKIMEAHGGRLWAESKHNAGTVMHMEFVRT